MINNMNDNITINDANNNINNNFCCFLSCVMARLAYLKMPDLFEKYIMVMKTIPSDIIKSIRDLKNTDMIFDDTFVFSGLDKSYFTQIDGHRFIDIIKLKLPQKINAIIANKKAAHLVSDKMVKMVEISNSNGNKTVIVADKNLNAIFVLFKGTDNIKVATSWLNPFKNIPIKPCEGSDNRFLTGIFKLAIENIHTIFYAISYLSNHFLESKTKNSNSNPIKIFTTGHSLGGGLCSIFSYLWVGLREINIDNLVSTISDKIICVSIASPKVFNEFLVENDFNTLLEQHKILYRRIVTIGDMFTIGPKYLRHPINANSLSYCTQTNNKTKKTINYKKQLICKNVKIKKNQLSLLPHGNYMYINFYHLLNRKEKNIIEKDNDNTIVQVIIAYTNINNMNEYKIIHFNLNDIRYENKHANANILHFSRPILNKEDQYMTMDLFKDIIANAQDFNVDDLMKTKLYTNNNRQILKLDVNKKMKPQNFICMTSKNMHKGIRKNKTRKLI